MNIFALALIVAAATTDTTTTGNSSGTTPTKKNSKSTATIVADPSAPADTTKSKKAKATEVVAEQKESTPTSLVGDSVDAATQIANDIAKAALDEAAKLAAIGSDTNNSDTLNTLVNPKTINAASEGVATVAKELKKPKSKKTSEDPATTEDPSAKPAKKTKPVKTDSATEAIPIEAPAVKN